METHEILKEGLNKKGFRFEITKDGSGYQIRAREGDPVFTEGYIVAASSSLPGLIYIIAAIAEFEKKS